MSNIDYTFFLKAPEVAVLVKYGQEVAYIAHFRPFLYFFNQFDLIEVKISTLAPLHFVIYYSRAFICLHKKY